MPADVAGYARQHAGRYVFLAYQCTFWIVYVECRANLKKQCFRLATYSIALSSLCQGSNWRRAHLI